MLSYDVCDELGVFNAFCTSDIFNLEFQDV